MFSPKPIAIDPAGWLDLMEQYMSAETDELEQLTNQDYKYGFVTDIEQDSAPPGLDEDTVRFISAKKGRAGLAA